MLIPITAANLEEKTCSQMLMKYCICLMFVESLGTMAWGMRVYRGYLARVFKLMPPQNPWTQGSASLVIANKNIEPPQYP